MSYLPTNHDKKKNKYDELTYAMENPAHEIILMRNRPQPGWFKDEHKLKSLTKKRNSALSLKMSRPTRSSSQRLRKIREELKSAINTAKNK